MGEPGIQRVKVYRLNEEGLWDDKGTGHVSVELMEVRCRSTLLPVRGGNRRWRLARASHAPRDGPGLLAAARAARRRSRRQPPTLPPNLARAAPAAPPVPALQGNSSVGLVVMGEGEGARPLLIHRISKENQYQRQGGEPGRRGWRQRGWQQPRPAAETSSSSRAMRWAAAAPGADLHHRCFPGDAGAGGVADRAPPCLLVPACLRAWLCRR